MYCFVAGVMQRLETFQGGNSVKLCAHLSGGDGDNAWQHTQLFRQKRDATDDTLRVKIVFH